MEKNYFETFFSDVGGEKNLVSFSSQKTVFDQIRLLQVSQSILKYLKVQQELVLNTLVSSWLLMPPLANLTSINVYNRPVESPSFTCSKDSNGGGGAREKYQPYLCAVPPAHTDQF